MTRYAAVLVGLLALACKIPVTVQVKVPPPVTTPAPPPVVAAPLVVSLAVNVVPSSATLTVDTRPAIAGVIQGTSVAFLVPAAQAGWGAWCDVHATGYDDVHVRVTVPTADGALPAVTLPPTLPPAPTRDEILTLRATFQGLTFHHATLGDIPAFEAVLPWLSAEDRASLYAAKHASPAFPGGDTHAILALPSGPSAYDEPGQPYTPANGFGPLDWTAGNTAIDGRLADLVVEVARAGFPRILLFLGGDDGPRGYPVAMAQLPLVADALEHSAYGDLRGYVVVLPGWDGVFYGYSPDQVASWGALCRQRMIYCGIEHQPGKIPVGNGSADYAPGGRMTTFDLILAEFNGPNDTAWRLQNPSGQANDYNGNQIWQVAARTLGNAFRRPGDEPADADAYVGAGYLGPGTPRGPYVACAFEWTGEYLWVRGRESAAAVQRDRDYFRSLGYPCSG